MTLDIHALGNRIKLARMAAKMTQADLADRIGVNQAQITRIEGGQTRSGLDHVPALAKALRVSEAYLLYGEAVTAAGEPVELADDPRAALIERYDSPAGLRELAAADELVQVVGITDKEWRTLASLAQAWPAAPLVPRDGWVAVVYSLRGIAPKIMGE